MKVEAIYVADVLEACKRLGEIPSATDTLVLMTGRLFEVFKSVGSTPSESYRLKNGDASLQPVISMGIYGMYTLSMVQIVLNAKTAWVAVTAFNYKEFSASCEKNVYIMDLKN